MVFQELSWLWPLGSHLAGHDKLGDAKYQAEALWDIFDYVERGLVWEQAPEELIRPCAGSGRLQRFHVVRSEGKRRYQLFTGNGDCLMSAFFSRTEPKVELFVHDPCEKGCDRSGPAFTMTCSKDHATWLLVQEQASPSSPSSPGRGSPSPSSRSGGQKRQLALIRHSCEAVGGGSARCMEVSLPCHDEGAGPGRAGEVDLASGVGVARQLVTRLPEWDGDVSSLTLDFEGRQVQPSAKNFQLALAGQSEQAVVFQHGRVAEDTFCLDFKAPLGVVQAFAAALTAACWT